MSIGYLGINSGHTGLDHLMRRYFFALNSAWRSGDDAGIRALVLAVCVHDRVPRLLLVLSHHKTREGQIPDCTKSSM